jgi:hypothetical protein
VRGGNGEGESGLLVVPGGLHGPGRGGEEDGGEGDEGDEDGEEEDDGGEVATHGVLPWRVREVRNMVAWKV